MQNMLKGNLVNNGIIIIDLDINDCYKLLISALWHNEYITQILIEAVFNPRKLYILGCQYTSSSNTLDLCLSILGEELGLHNYRLFGKDSFAQDFEVTLHKNSEC